MASIYHGDMQSIGDGKARTFLCLSNDKKPSALGIEFTEAGSVELPVIPITYQLCLPQESFDLVPFFTASIQWHPLIVGSQDYYSGNYLGFQFSLLPNLKRLAIRPGSACGRFVDNIVCEKVYKPIPTGYYPSGFQTIPDSGRPFSGAYMANPRMKATVAPLMTDLFWGQYDGKLAFVEPILSPEFLQAIRCRGEVSVPIPLPPFFNYSGWYPSLYKVKYCKGVYTLSLEGFCFYNGRPSREIALTSDEPLFFDAGSDSCGCSSNMVGDSNPPIRGACRIESTFTGSVDDVTQRLTDALVNRLGGTLDTTNHTFTIPPDTELGNNFPIEGTYEIITEPSNLIVIFADSVPNGMITGTQCLLANFFFKEYLGG